VIETERLRLRQLTPADGSVLLDVFADPYAREFYPDMTDYAWVVRWIEWNLGNYEKFGYGLWGMELKSSGELIGDCGLTWQQVEVRSELEIGYHVLARERRRGYATEGARACLDWGFRHTDSAMICSIVRPANLASCTVAGRVHPARREFERRGQPVLLFYTMRSDWEMAGR